ncbi:Polyadenylation and cleavage factor-like 4 [Hondaea fermentalgiana]|uniref:Polyadenylation and cleavage factor-like 4 n=1 Tax=Hondaea fermentalgiana TaxID=2315210 RepID=A0A2R5G7R2_9STRA|nr:Polyadenylation and cleavage factor-like 4 [Hondaea fermentalgiana]|eukprot:GBG26369.1 Polyadenylation and cleavage factor-like 4 [Hondaea fermentalgiana]
MTDANSRIADYVNRIRVMGSHPDKITINTLTMVAGDVKKGSVSGVEPSDIVGAIEARLLRAPPREKMPAMYLMDSIMYNVRDPYPKLFSRGLPNLFMDTFRSLDDAGKNQLRKLLNAWPDRRPDQGALPPKVLGDIFAKIDRRFDVDDFVRRQEDKFPEWKQQAPSAAPAPGPYGHAPPPHGQPYGGGHGSAGHADTSAMPTPLNTSVTQEQYDQLLVERATTILSDLQNSLGVPNEERIQLNDLPERPELWQQVYDRARAELSAAGISVYSGAAASMRVAPTYVAGSQPSAFQPHGELHYGQGSIPGHAAAASSHASTGYSGGYAQPPRTPPAAPSPKPRPSWDMESLRDTSQAVQVAATLYQMCQSDGQHVDPVSGLRFTDPSRLQAYQAQRSELEKEIVASRKPPSANKMLRRAWFNAPDLWRQVAPQELRVEQSGFDVTDDDDVDLADASGAGAGESTLNRQTSNLSLGGEAGVPIDDSQTHCALTGEELEKTFDDESGQWVYKGTIRDPEGRIVIASAYYEQQAKKRQRSESAADASTPATKQAKHDV